MAALPHELEHPPGGGDADHVEDHRLQRQQQRAEGPREQHEGDQRDQGDHQREVAVHGADEVLVLRRPGRRRPRRVPAPARPCAPDRASRARSPMEASGVGEGVDDCRAGTAPLRRRRRHGAVHAGHRGERRRDLLGRGRAGDEHLIGHERARADARPLEREEALLGVPLFGDRVHVGDAELQVRRRQHERREHERAAERRHPAPAHDEVGPAGPGAARLVVVADVRPVKARAELAEHDGEQRHRDEHADQRDQHAAVSDRAQEGERQRDEREQADRDGRAAEHHRAARRLHGAFDRRVAAQSVGALLAPARRRSEAQ